jgi:hypothetical protein
MLMANVVRLADRFLDAERQERLFSCVSLVAVFYLILSIAFFKLGEIEKRHHIRHADPDVQFELMIAPPPTKPIELVPQSTSLDTGKANIGGQTSGAAKTEETKIAAVNNNTKIEEKAHKRSSKLSEDAPLNVGSTNEIKHVLSQNAAQSSGVTTVKQSSNSEVTNGSTLSNGAGTDPIGIGAGGIGIGHGATVGDGEEDDIAGGEKVTMRMRDGRALGNIAPYRKALLIKIAQEWRPLKKHEVVVVLLRLAQDGTVISADVTGSTSKRAAENAARVLSEMQFEPLPDWYRGPELTFEVHLSADGVTADR